MTIYFVAYKLNTEIKVVEFETREDMIAFCDSASKVGFVVICVWAERQ